MKKLIPRILGALCACSMFLFPCSALALDVNGFDFPETVYTDNSFKTTADDIYEKLQQNSTIQELNSCIICVGSRSGLDVSLFIGVPNTQFHYSGFWGNGLIYVCDSFNGVVSYNDLESYVFSFTPNTVLPSTPPEKTNGFFVHDNIYSPCFAYANPSVNMTGFYFDSKAVYAYLSPEFVAEFETVNLPFYSLDVDDFYTWLVNNDKIAVDSSGTVSGKIPTYIGIQKLKSFLNFYKQFGSSNKTFMEKIQSWFSFMNIVGQTKNNIAVLKNTTDSLYQEYLNYISGTHAYWPNATHIQERDTIDTKTDNNDLTLITDDSNDTLDISILRDILRGIIAISNNFNQGCSKIIQKLEELNFIVNVVNDGGDLAPLDLSPLWVYPVDVYNDDLANFLLEIEEAQSIPQGYIDTINDNALMPENMLEDKNSLTVNVPCITGFTIGNDGTSYSTQTGSYTLSSSEYPWLDPVVQKIKRFGSIILILGYLVHLRYRIPELIRGE